MPAIATAAPATPEAIPRNSASRVLFASLIGTTIEFFDFYIYATAAVLVFPTLFFPSSARDHCSGATTDPGTRTFIVASE